jgi:hypothetical protein
MNPFPRLLFISIVLFLFIGQHEKRTGTLVNESPQKEIVINTEPGQGILSSARFPEWGPADPGPVPAKERVIHKWQLKEQYDSSEASFRCKDLNGHFSERRYCEIQKTGFTEHQSSSREDPVLPKFL